MRRMLWGALLAPLLVTVTLAAPSEQRQRELVELLKHECGSCHGLTLQGGLGPALTPARIGAWMPEALKEVILNGRAGTPMPPWRGLLSEQDAAWLARLLQRGVDDHDG